MMTSNDVEFTASRLFVISDWLEQFGKSIYHIRSDNGIRKRYPEQPLADGWEIFKHQNRIFIFLSKNRISEERKHSFRIKMTPKQVEKIRSTDFSKRGSQRRLAEEMGFHESYISRVRRKLMRKNDEKAKILNDKQKESLYLSRENVIEFFETVYSGNEWFDKYRKKYNLKHLQIIYNMLNFGQPEMPDNWKGVRIGKYWYLYQTDVN